MFKPPLGCQFYRSISIVVSVVVAGPCFAQGLDLASAVQRGLGNHPSVQAAEARVEAARAGQSRARAGFNPEVELAPGVGFTNGNNLISQRFDIGGVRSAHVAVAQAELDGAVARLQAVRQGRAAEVGRAYYEVVGARAELAVVEESAALSRQLVDLVRKRVEVGEAAEVQVTRTQLEAMRVEQELLRARGAAETKLKVLASLLGEDSLSLDATPSELPGIGAAPNVAELTAAALANRADVALARSELRVAQSELQLGRANRKPSLHAGIAADIWSLDRQPFQRDNLGLQAFISFPLFDRGSLKAEDNRHQALVSAARADLAAIERGVNLEVTQAGADLISRQAVAAHYATRILPEAEKLIRMTTAGYEAGLTTLIDVLDAQRTARQTRLEYIAALHDAARAELELRRATASLAPPNQEKPN